MLWFLHLAADAGVVVTAYADAPYGRMVETEDGGGHLEEVMLRPAVSVSSTLDEPTVARLHHRAHQLCFIANSVNFPVRCDARVIAQPATTSPADRRSSASVPSA